MRVLLVGEYSGLHNCLKQGLSALNVECVLASDGDAWKEFPSDVHFAAPFRAGSPVGRVMKNVSPFVVLPDPAQFDVVQLISPLILTPRFGINGAFVRRVARRARRLFFLAAGDDSFYFRSLSAFRYNPIGDYLAIDLKGGSSPWSGKRLARMNEWLAERADGVIPVAYEYSVGYKRCRARRPIIPMPVDVSAYACTPNVPGRKVTFLHGINRPGFKGTKYILEAFRIAERKWNSKAEFRVVERLPIREYVQAIREANVVVDQALSYSYAMNALISMAMGRVVMSGAEPEAVEHLDGRCPVINIQPDPEQIAAEIDRVMMWPERLPAVGLESREFVERNHSHVRVAGRFAKAWE